MKMIIIICHKLRTLSGELTLPSILSFEYFTTLFSLMYNYSYIHLINI